MVPTQMQRTAVRDGGDTIPLRGKVVSEMYGLTRFMAIRTTGVAAFERWKLHRGATLGGVLGAPGWNVRTDSLPMRRDERPTQQRLVQARATGMIQVFALMSTVCTLTAA